MQDEAEPGTTIERDLVLRTRRKGFRIAAGVLGVLCVPSALVPFAVEDDGTSSLLAWATAALMLAAAWVLLRVARHGEARIPLGRTTEQ